MNKINERILNRDQMVDICRVAGWLIDLDSTNGSEREEALAEAMAEFQTDYRLIDQETLDILDEMFSDLLTKMENTVEQWTPTEAI